MKFLTNYNKTPLYLAVEKENLEIVKLLINNNKINLNIPYILLYFFIEFDIHLFNYIFKIN